MGKNPSHDYGVGDNYPVYNVSWDDIQEFESALNNAFRLPSESELEYACRAGTATRFYWGNDLNYTAIGYYAVYSGNDADGAEEVGSKLPNDWDLYDMIGNAWEWCEDTWPSDYENAPDDGSPWLIDSEESKRVYRGGAWFNYLEFYRSASRAGSYQDLFGYTDGFRLVLVR